MRWLLLITVLACVAGCPKSKKACKEFESFDECERAPHCTAWREQRESGGDTWSCRPNEER